MSDGFNCGVQSYIDVCSFKFCYDDGGGQEVESALLLFWFALLFMVFEWMCSSFGV